MIELYTWGTPNGRKVSVMLEEVGLPYTVHPVDIRKGEQRKPEFVAINPNSKIPAIVDPDGPGGEPITVFESGAILIYLAEKAKSELLPADPHKRYAALEWLMFQMGSVGPMFGQAHHFLHRPKVDVPYGKERYHNETKRLYGVMDGRLGKAAYLAGDAYTVADVATYPWVGRHQRHQVDLSEFPNVKRWFDELSKRPAVAKGMNTPPDA
ncbi:MAG: glutathione binding-like protein [Rhodospirillales bacterium]